jgi:glycosyltransferase involved in cell wall biosynthesis
VSGSSGRRLRFLHVIQLYHPVKSGAARFFEEIGARLAAEGHDVIALATDAYDLEHLWLAGRRRVEAPTELHRGVRIVRLPIRRMPGPPVLYPALRRLMAEISRVPGSAPLLRRLAQLTPRMPGVAGWLARNGPFDMIHAANITLDFAILPALNYARRHNLPFVCTPFVHLGEPGDRALLRYYAMRHHIELLRASDRVITMTDLEAEFLASQGIARERLRRVGVGVEPAELAGGDPARFRATYHVQEPLVLYIGALARDKGAIDTVEALRQLWRAGSKATLALIGAPLAHFSSYYEQLPGEVRERIRLLPYAPDEVKRDALAAANLLALPSRTDSFGIVLLEAWCYGVPVIGARAGGVPDVITDRRDGLLVPYGDVPALAAAIQRLLDNPAEAERLGAAGRAKVQRELTWERVYETARGVYAEVVDLPARH